MDCVLVFFTIIIDVDENRLRAKKSAILKYKIVLNFKVYCSILFHNK